MKDTVVKGTISHKNTQSDGLAPRGEPKKGSVTSKNTQSDGLASRGEPQKGNASYKGRY